MTGQSSFLFSHVFNVIIHLFILSIIFTYHTGREAFPFCQTIIKSRNKYTYMYNHLLLVSSDDRATKADLKPEDAPQIQLTDSKKAARRLPDALIVGVSKYYHSRMGKLSD